MGTENEGTFFVEDLTLTNFRGLQKQMAIPLEPATTLFVGENGAGKSAVLDALASLVAVIPALLAGSTGRLLEARDTRNVGSDGPNSEWAILLATPFSPESLSWKLWASLETALPAEGGGEADVWTLLFDKGRGLPAHTPLPLLVHIHSSSTRPALARSISEESLPGRLAGYSGAFDNESLQFEALEVWFEREENLENEQKIAKRNFGHALPSLRAVRSALRAFLTTLQNTPLGELSVMRTHDDGPLQPARGELVIQKGKGRLFLNQLSDGERRLVLMIADTARRMVILNPQMKDPLLSPGLLIIDEIELHLHPRWQRTVMAAVRAAFPRVQIVAATHSPAVLASVPNDAVRVLKDGKLLDQPAPTYARDPNTLLETVMDAPLLPEEVDQDLSALFKAIDANRLPDAKKRIKVLSASLGRDHPELVRARALVEFAGA